MLLRWAITIDLEPLLMGVKALPKSCFFLLTMDLGFGYAEFISALLNLRVIFIDGNRD